DDEHHERLLADGRDLARRGRLDVAQAAGPELASLAGQRKSRAAGVDEVELVLLLVVVRPRLDPRLDHEHVHAERGHAQLLPHLPEDAVAQLVDGAERVAHAEEASPYDRVRGPGDRTGVYEELADDPSGAPNGRSRSSASRPTWSRDP